MVRLQAFYLTINDAYTDGQSIVEQPVLMPRGQVDQYLSTMQARGLSLQAHELTFEVEPDEISFWLEYGYEIVAQDDRKSLSNIYSADRLCCPNCKEYGGYVETVDEQDCYDCNKCGWDWQYPSGIVYRGCEIRVEEVRTPYESFGWRWKVFLDGDAIGDNSKQHGEDTAELALFHAQQHVDWFLD